ncbi:MAG: saccharopine dehydrogenase NADP-binding domain-containing protein, partial [Deltaproteobacteria bacterium]|nr:saccharopine dehydrogenase NADP-binding domain-containing protein [Deltaproteobacteria bacterium]
MKVLCLGAGGMGALAAETIALFSEIERMTIADLNQDAAQAVADRCGTKAGACSINVMDRDSLVGLMTGHDAMLNCVGPFFRFAMPILTCAIAA